MLIKYGFCLFALALLSAGRATAVDQQPQEQTRSFDVRELLRAVPQSAGPGMASSKPAEAPSDDPERRLLTAIHASFAAPGALRKLEVKDGQLVATGTETQLQALEELVGQLKRQRSLQVNVEARLITVTERGLASMPDELRLKVARASVGQQPLTDQEVALLIERARGATEDIQAANAPNLTLINQQSAWAQMALQHTPHEPGLEGDVCQPPIEGAWSGIRLNARAAASADGADVSACIHLLMQRVLGFDEVRVKGTNAITHVPRLERVEIDRISLGRGPILLEAKALESPEEAAAKQPRLVLVIVRLTPIVERRNADPANAPPARP